MDKREKGKKKLILEVEAESDSVERIAAMGTRRTHAPSKGGGRTGGDHELAQKNWSFRSERGPVSRERGVERGSGGGEIKTFRRVRQWEKKKLNSVEIE